MSPVALASVFAGAVALVLGCAGGAVYLWRRSRSRRLERRLQRVAAPLAGLAGDVAQAANIEDVFRSGKRRARLAWLWRPLARHYPLVSPPKAFAFAVLAGLAGVAFAAFSLGFLKVPAGWWTLPLVSTAGALSAWQALRWQQAKREAQFIRQFPEIVDQMVRLTGAGVPAVESLAVVAQDAQEPVRSVLQEVSVALRAGLDADRALRMTSDRLRLAEFTLFAAVLRLQRRTGGGISGAFANLAATSRARNETALRAHASTAQVRLTLLVLSVLPVFVLIAQQFTSPATVELLFGTEQGTMLLRVGIGLIVAGLLVARAIAARRMR